MKKRFLVEEQVGALDWSDGDERNVLMYESARPLARYVFEMDIISTHI